MSDNGFERILQEIHNQKEYLEVLLAENADLRRQLADLRVGRGIFVEIADKRFALVGDTLMAVEDAPTTSFSSMNDRSFYSQSFVEQIPNNFIDKPSLLSTGEFEQSAYSTDESEEQTLEATGSSAFLEEILVDEFAAAATVTMPTSKRSETRKLPLIDENEKEALRKELVGSFLLE
jgi:hypothetical protein